MRYAFTENSWREATEDEDEGCVYATVTAVGNYHYTIEAEQYYFKDGTLKLVITQGLERALATFNALLIADANQEENARDQA